MQKKRKYKYQNFVDEADLVWFCSTVIKKTHSSVSEQINGQKGKGEER